ncbi:MAG: extracellular solute-binding protein [Actinobacteria bacterium]|nr:extracellular solute-binding protein [Actinomycetota bacterium]
MSVPLHLVYRTFASFDASFGQQRDAFRAGSPTYDLTLEPLDLEPLHRRMFAEGGLTDGSVDVFLCVTDWLPQAIARAGLVRLDEYLAAEPPDGWPDAWPPALLGLQRDAAGAIYGLPYHDGPECFMYRADLFEDPAEGARFRARFGYDLRVPDTWGQFLDLARFFHRPDAGLAGCLIAAYPDAHNNVYDFLIHLWSRGGELLDRGNRVAFDTSIARDALQWYVDLAHRHGVTQPNPWEHDSIASGIQFAQGRAAMMWNWCGFAAVADLPESQVRGKVRVTQIPQGDGPAGVRASLNIYWVLTVPAGSRHPHAAYRFCRGAIGPAMDLATSLAGGNGCRLSTWSHPAVLRQFPYYAAIPQIHQHTRTLPAIPRLAGLLDVLNRMVDDAMRLRKSVDLAIRDGAAEARDLLQ